MICLVSVLNLIFICWFYFFLYDLIVYFKYEGSTPEQWCTIPKQYLEKMKNDTNFYVITEIEKNMLDNLSFFSLFISCFIVVIIC
jgi:hypothetical protein